MRFKARFILRFKKRFNLSPTADWDSGKVSRRFQKVLKRIRCQNQNHKRPFVYYTGYPPRPRWSVSFFGYRRVEARSVVSRNAPITYAVRIMPMQPHMQLRTACHVRAYACAHASDYAPLTCRSRPPWHVRPICPHVRATRPAWHVCVPPDMCRLWA